MADIEEVLRPHRGIEIVGGRMWCTCGALLWTAADGYVAGPLVHAPGEAVGECAFRHHQAAALDEAGIGDKAQAWDEGFASDYEGDGWPPNPYRRQRAEEVGGDE